jgi:DNA-binding response OmpR family regulator
LVVEDDADIRKAVTFRLHQAGFETLTAEDGEAGIRIVRAMKPALVVLDLMLPKLSGEEICKAIREDDDPVFSKTPIIMVTAKGSEAERIVGRVIGANAYLTKPFDMDEMIKNVMKYVNA